MPYCNEQQAYAVAASLDHCQAGGQDYHHLYLRLSDIHRRQAATTGLSPDGQWALQDYLDSWPGIRAMVKRLPHTSS